MGAIVLGGRKERLELSLAVAARIATFFSRKLLLSSQLLVIYLPVLVLYALGRLTSLQVLIGIFSTIFLALISLISILAMKEWTVQVKTQVLQT